ncbi:Glycosyltransferase involved in cell wall bisynthesis [Chitinophaga sp. CF118]|uniref:glycosyltransferase family 4 protein n=1 Tax=Chitinophaga sp. CF118 TaxID=1884367 RepID=UPI0008ED8BCD|nr:glycosyltransferase family 4 protein [Chitinophaga sp. CF118]SFE26270.1 Glycosyltransferase involved in cell wall bisynthesis [Chitinophaga sp. CF118]
MKILFTVESYLPARSGMQEVVMQLSERLVKRGHELTIATSGNSNRKSNIINGVNVQGFNIDGNSVLGYNGDIESYRQYLLNADFDIVVNFAAQQWATDLALPLIKKIKGKKVFVPTGFSGLNNPLYESYYEKMGEWLRSYDVNVFLSDKYRDINFARNNSVDNYIIIPNGAATEEFENSEEEDIRKQLGIKEHQFMILQVGAFTGAKGQLESMRIFNKARIKDAVLVLAGNDMHQHSIYAGVANFIKLLVSGVSNFRPRGIRYYKIMALLSNYLNYRNRLRRKSVTVIELERRDVVAAFKSADLFLFPSMIECSPIVLFESMAGKTPFLTADVGNASEIIQWTGGGMILPTSIGRDGMSYVNIRDSATLLETLWMNKQLRKEMAEKGYSGFLESFTWEKITGKYEDLFMQLYTQ